MDSPAPFNSGRPAWLLPAVIIGGLFYIAGQYVASQPQRIQKETEANREISVQGTGEVQSRPDVARLSLGVRISPQPTAAGALKLLTGKFNDVVAAVKKSGVKDEDIKTANLSLQPEYDYSNGQQTLKGFSASEAIEVKVRNLDKIGEILAAATVEGVNQAGALSFEVDQPEALQAEAQQKAIADARSKAEQLAKSLGVRLGDVKKFAATLEAPNQPLMYSQADLKGLGGGEGVAVPPGSQETRAEVTITYSLR